MPHLSQPALLGLRRQRLVEEGRDPVTGRQGDTTLHAPRTVLPDQNWQAWFEAINQASGGRGIKFRGGPSALGSNQIRGQKPNRPSLDAIQSIMDDPTSSFHDNAYFGRGANFQNARAEKRRNAQTADDYMTSWKGRL